MQIWKEQSTILALFGRRILGQYPAGPSSPGPFVLLLKEERTNPDNLRQNRGVFKILDKNRESPKKDTKGPRRTSQEDKPKSGNPPPLNPPPRIPALEASGLDLKSLAVGAVKLRIGSKSLGEP